MAFEELKSKKYMDGKGTQHLWERIRSRYDPKLDRIEANNASIKVTGQNRLEVVISQEPGNMLQLKTSGERGLYVQDPGEADKYSIVKDADPGIYAAVYHLQKYSTQNDEYTNIGAAINIPRDMVVKQGTVVTKEEAGEWGNEGTYIELILATEDNQKLYIPVDGLIEYVTSGSQLNDMVVVAVNPETHQVTASITDGTITKAKLEPSLQRAINNAVQGGVQVIEESETPGAIQVDGMTVRIHGWGTAAEKSVEYFEGLISAGKSELLGTNADTAADLTLYGIKQYASDAYEAIQALSNAEIDAAIANGDANVEAG